MTTAGLTRPDPFARASVAIRSPRDRTVFLAALPVPLLVLGAVMMGNSTLAMVAAVVALPVAVISPVVGLTMVALIAPVVTQPILPYPGINALLLAASIFGSIIRLPLERPRLTVGLPLLAMFALLFYVFAQQIPAMLAAYVGEHEAAGSYFLRLTTGGLAVVAAALALKGRSPYPVIAGLVVAAVVVVSLAMMTFDGGQAGPLFSNLIARTDEGVRPSGPFWNPNYYGWYVSAMLLLVLGVLLEFRGTLRWALGGLAAFLALGVAISLSRGAFASLLVGIIALGFARSRRTGVATLVVAGACAVVLLPILVEWRLTGGVGEVSQREAAEFANSDQSRLAAVLEGPTLFLSSPFFGHGPGSFALLAGVAPHNWYMSVLAELGIVGLVLLVIFLLSVLAGLLHLPRLPRSIGIALLAQLVVNSMFLEPGSETQGSIPIALTITAAFVADWRGHAARDRGRVDLAGRPIT